MKSTIWPFPLKWLFRLSLFYLILPFCIFCVGFLKPYIGLPIAVILIFLFIRLWRTQNEEDQIKLSQSSWIIVLLIAIFWVILSGIGGFAFQNTDFHIRNAIFHDLISYPWPVKYNFNPVDPTITYSLTYYIGFWLPAALIGKLVGWTIANIVLFLWSLIGITLSILLLAPKLKLHPVKLILLFIFFSGMDAFGRLIIMGGLAGSQNLFNNIWPPIKHLEWWAQYFQYSSFTTQLFWVFNQAIPTWLCMSLLLTAKDRKLILFIWSLCCFFAPIPALGMFPYVVLKLFKDLFNPENVQQKEPDAEKNSFFRRAYKDILSVVTLENIIGGGIVLFITYSYFSTNAQSTASTVNDLSFTFWFFYLLFIILEGFFLWFVLKKANKTNLNWYLAGLMIVTIPFIKIGGSQDFSMRASIPTLFMLFVWTANMLGETKSQSRNFLIILLCIGAITPLYEINRSIYRTANFLIAPPSLMQSEEGEKVNIYVPMDIVHDHPYTLTANSFKSLANFNPDNISNFISKNEYSFFETYLEK